MPISKLQVKSWLEVLLSSQDQNFTWGSCRVNLLGMDTLAGDPNTAKNFPTIQLMNHLKISRLMALSMVSCGKLKVCSLRKIFVRCILGRKYGLKSCTAENTDFQFSELYKPLSFKYTLHLGWTDACAQLMFRKWNFNKRLQACFLCYWSLCVLVFRLREDLQTVVFQSDLVILVLCCKFL